MYKVAIFLQQKGDRTGGWTFSLWNSKTDVTALINAINVLAQDMQTLTGYGCNVIKARYGLDGNFRVADEIKYNYATVPGTNPDDNADYQTTAIGIQFRADPNYKVSQSIRGIADGKVFNAGRLNPAFTTGSAWTNFRTTLVSSANGWVLRVLDKTRVKKIVKAISNDGIVTCTAHGFDGSVKVRIERCKQNKYPNQIWDVESLTTNTFQLVGFQDPNPGGYIVKGCKARPQIYVTPGIGSATPIRATSHKTGRPTDLLSGKSKKKK